MQQLLMEHGTPLILVSGSGADLFQVPHTLQRDVPFLEVLDDRGGECCLRSTTVAGSVSLQVACHSSEGRCIGVHIIRDVSFYIF